jgi:cytochrome c553
VRAALALLLVVAAPAVSAAADERLAPCLACHGETGQSPNPDVPSLGGQHSPYALIQLFMFREGMRAAAPMTDLMKGVSDEDLQATADAVATLPPPPPPADAGDGERVERGRAAAAQFHCNVCHRADFSGQENVPRIGDQREDYLLKALTEYKSGARHGYDAAMAEALQPVGESALPDLAHYIAHAR